MADMTQAPLNGNYAGQHGFHDSFNSQPHVAMNTAANFQPAQSSTPTTATPTDKNGISKDEVGWFFVEQYYTTMSRNPDKLHLFYSKRSQLVFGTEAESVPVSVGNKAIGDKIKQLDFQECKVRVLNVDSQASFDNILVSVIGEISNKSEPSRKFIQTFVLAEQPNGYYVLNDIFRYLADEQEEVEEEAEVAEPVAEAPKVEEPVPAAEAQVTDEATASKVDEKLEQETNGEVEQPEVAPQTNGTPAEEVEAPVPAVETEILKQDKPATPVPTPAPEQEIKEEAPVEESAPAPSLPKTWANIASKPGAKPVVPAIPAAAPKAATPTTPAASAAQPAAAAAAAAPAAKAVPKQASSNEAGWQTAGADHKKTQSRAGEEQTVMGYIKNVTDKVDAELLETVLSRFGKLKYIDVNRSKNCAFIEYIEPAGYAAAVAANPHKVGSEQILVEERRPRGNAFGGNGFAPGRGGAGRGRGDRAGSQGRGGFQRDGRGGFTPRGRGGNAPAKGRSQAQAA
ncbi:hypothetical protein N7523_009000 [Penicillium sp. IBT 18751x]|nr:hypothetical protein N7523_009000 [Penicillium sp. IBT 18751x]